jgi:hypothetical protein
MFLLLKASAITKRVTLCAIGKYEGISCGAVDEAAAGSLNIDVRIDYAARAVA